MRLRTLFRKYNDWVTVGVLVVVGFWFRWKGIVNNHSFWADEALISGFSRDVIQNKLTLTQVLSKLQYQQLQVIITAIALKLGGINELAARIPTVIWGTLGIGLAYAIGKKLSNWGGGILAGFLYAFSQLNLAHSTQAKPYTGLETLFLAIIYLGLNKKIKHRYWWLFGLAAISTWLHVIGILSFGFIGIIYLLENNSKRLNKKGWLWLVGGLVIIVFLGQKTIMNVLFHISWYNNTTYLREFFWKNYDFILLPAIFGGAISYKKYKNVLISLCVWSLLLLGVWNFKSYSHNIRYLMPFFGVILVFFGVFWAKVGETFFNDKLGLIAIVVALVLYAGGNKIVRKPLLYYNPNLDLYGDVQNADYKTMFQQLQMRFKDQQNVFIIDDVPDAEIWYFPKMANAYFNITAKPNQKYVYRNKQIPIHKTVDQLKQIEKMHSKGIVIVEDWQSFMPNEIKNYVKNNYYFEFKVPSLSQRGGNYPLTVYSWGQP